MIQIQNGAEEFHPVTLTAIAGCGTARPEKAVCVLCSSLSKGCQPLYNLFDHRQLTDNLSSWDSIFLQAPKVVYLEPICTAVEVKVMEHLAKKNTLMNRTRAAKFVQQEEQILGTCLTSYLL